MVQIEGQLTLNSFLSDAAPIGYVDESKVGVPIPFQRLKDYIGKKVIYQTQGNGKTQRVVMVKKYYESSDTFYSDEEGNTINEYVLSLSSEEKKKRFKKAFSCDRIAYSDDARTLKANSWLSEAYCSNGRHQVVHNASSVCFYEYKAM